MDTETTTAQTADIVPEARKSYSRALLNIAVFFVITLVIVLPLRHFFPDDISNVKLYLINYIPMYGIAFPIYLLISKPLPKTVPEPKKMSVGHLLLTFLCCQCIAIGGNLIGVTINMILSMIIGQNTASMFLVNGVFGEGVEVFLVIAVLFGPFVEEMLFRKILIDRIRKYGDKTAIIISGLMFGLFHGNLTQVFYAAGVGFIFAFVYIRTGKTRYNILLHMMMNFWGTVIPWLATRNVDMFAVLKAAQEMDLNYLVSVTSDLMPMLVVGCLNYMFAIAGLVLLILKRRDLKVNPPIAPLPKEKRFSVPCLNAGFIAMLTVCIIQFIRQFMDILQS